MSSVGLKSWGWERWTALLVVFVVALVFRAVCLGDSFWVDELHTAWCAEGAFGEVAGRAAMGNQGPIYSWGMWVWRWLLGAAGWGGGVEGGMRWTSAVAGSAAAAAVAGSVMTLCGGGRLHRRTAVAGGLTGGLAMAVDVHAIFFGTELRVYSVVTAVIAVWWWAMGGALVVGRRDRAWWFSVAAAAVTWWLHRTAVVLPVGAMGWLIMSRSVDRRSLDRRSVVMGVLGVGLVVGFGFVGALSETWRSRGLWGSFARAKSIADVWTIWPASVWVILPALALAGDALLARVDRGGFAPARRALAVTVASIVLTVALFGVASAIGGVHLWHRRYMVSLLPIGAAAMGLSVALAMETAGRWGPRWRGVTGAAAATVMVGVLMIQQGTAGVLLGGRMQWIRRGEDWRGAAGWINRQWAAENQTAVWVDAGLIESSAVPLDKNSMDQDGLPQRTVAYLSYPLRGSYRVAATVRPFSLSQTIRGGGLELSDGELAVVRAPATAVASAVRGGDPEGVGFEVLDFGGVCVIRNRPDPEGLTIGEPR